MRSSRSTGGSTPPLSNTPASSSPRSSTTCQRPFCSMRTSTKRKHISKSPTTSSPISSSAQSSLTTKSSDRTRAKMKRSPKRGRHSRRSNSCSCETGSPGPPGKVDFAETWAAGKALRRDARADLLPRMGCEPTPARRRLKGPWPPLIPPQSTVFGYWHTAFPPGDSLTRAKPLSLCILKDMYKYTRAQALAHASAHTKS